MALKFYISVAKELKLKVGIIWGLIPTLGEVTGENLVGAPFWLPSLAEVRGTHFSRFDFKCFFVND